MAPGSTNQSCSLGIIKCPRLLFYRVLHRGIKLLALSRCGLADFEVFIRTGAADLRGLPLSIEVNLLAWRYPLSGLVIIGYILLVHVGADAGGIEPLPCNKCACFWVLPPIVRLCFEVGKDRLRCCQVCFILDALNIASGLSNSNTKARYRTTNRASPSNIDSGRIDLRCRIAKISGWYPHQRTPIFENMLFDAAVPVFVVVVGLAFFQPE